MRKRTRNDVSLKLKRAHARVESRSGMTKGPARMAVPQRKALAESEAELAQSVEDEEAVTAEEEMLSCSEGSTAEASDISSEQDVLQSDSEPEEASADAAETEDEDEDERVPSRVVPDIVLSEDEDDEEDDHEGRLLAQVPEDDRNALRDMIERAVEATRKNSNQALRGTLSRKEVLVQLCRALSKYYGYNEELTKYFLTFFGSEECLEFFEACDGPRPTTIRCNTLKTRRKDLAHTLIARGVNVDVLGEWSKHGLVVVDSTVPVGATPEYLAGHYMLQAASSLLPVIALKPRPDELILDMAAAPGGKSSYIAQLMRNTGCIVANDVNKTRCFALAANLHRLGVRNALVCDLDGRKLLDHFNKKSFDRVLLDAPCSGSGVFSKDAGAKLKRTPQDFMNLQSLQKELLCQAVDLCKVSDTSNGISGTGHGVIVYSTCSVSVEENEGVIDYILKHRNVKLVDTEIPFGIPGLIRYRDKRFNENISKTRRFYPHKNNMDGFFVAKLVKLSD